MNVILSHLILNLYHFDIYKFHLVDKFLSCVCLCMYVCDMSPHVGEYQFVCIYVHMHMEARRYI